MPSRRRLAVPARTLRVHLRVEPLVLLRRLLEGVPKRHVGDLVVVVDELATAFLGVGDVGPRRQLRRVPREIDVQGWNRHLSGVAGHDVDEAEIFPYEAGNCVSGRWAV